MDYCKEEGDSYVLIGKAKEFPTLKDWCQWTGINYVEGNVGHTHKDSDGKEYRYKTFGFICQDSNMLRDGVTSMLHQIRETAKTTLFVRAPIQIEYDSGRNLFKVRCRCIGDY